MEQNIKDLLESLPDISHQLEEAQQSGKMAHDSLDQLNSLLPDKGSTNMEMLDKVIAHHPEVLMYGQALVHATDHILAIKPDLSTRFRILFNKKARQTLQERKEAMQLAITYLTLIRIKADLFERYEVDDRKKK